MEKSVEIFYLDYRGSGGDMALSLVPNLQVAAYWDLLCSPGLGYCSSSVIIVQHLSLPT